MITRYKYKEKTYSNIYELSEGLGQEGIFIPLSIDDETLAELNVTVMHEEEPLEVIKQRKITELKYRRDKAEVEPIEYNGHSFDYDDKARDRINSAIIALDVMGDGKTIEWTLADNTNVTVTANDLRGVVANVAVRSNKLHVKYRELKELVETCTTNEELDLICWDEPKESIIEQDTPSNDTENIEVDNTNNPDNKEE